MAGRVVELRESHIKAHALVPERAMEQRHEVPTGTAGLFRDVISNIT